MAEALFRRDEYGRTALFDAALRGDRSAVEEMIFSLAGTGTFPPRLALLAIQDHTGMTAADIAEQHGHHEIAQLLRREASRMEHSE